MVIRASSLGVADPKASQGNWFTQHKLDTPALFPRQDCCSKKEELELQGMGSLSEDLGRVAGTLGALLEISTYLSRPSTRRV